MQKEQVIQAMRILWEQLPDTLPIATYEEAMSVLEFAFGKPVYLEFVPVGEPVVTAYPDGSSDVDLKVIPKPLDYSALFDAYVSQHDALTP